MVPFSCFEEVTITWVISSGNYTVDTVVAKGRTSTGEELEFTMVQKWPIKQAFLEGEKVPSHEIMDVGLRVLDTQFRFLREERSVLLDLLELGNGIAAPFIQICCCRHCSFVCLWRACGGGCRNLTGVPSSQRPSYRAVFDAQNLYYL